MSPTVLRRVLDGKVVTCRNPFSRTRPEVFENLVGRKRQALRYWTVVVSAVHGLSYYSLQSAGPLSNVVYSSSPTPWSSTLFLRSDPRTPTKQWEGDHLFVTEWRSSLEPERPYLKSRWYLCHVPSRVCYCLWEVDTFTINQGYDFGVGRFLVSQFPKDPVLEKEMPSHWDFGTECLKSRVLSVGPSTNFTSEESTRRLRRLSIRTLSST